MPKLLMVRTPSKEQKNLLVFLEEQGYTIEYQDTGDKFKGLEANVLYWDETTKEIKYGPKV